MGENEPVVFLGRSRFPGRELLEVGCADVDVCWEEESPVSVESVLLVRDFLAGETEVSSSTAESGEPVFLLLFDDILLKS